MSDATKAVFLSYARDDAAAARRIAEALRASGVEVWFDENELRGGDSWDAKIRKQINDCTLFLPIVSRHTQERGKGYFRLEWKLAVEQTHLMAEGMAFLAPVVIDDTPESGALVPPEFLKVQWTRLPGALPTPQFVGQVQRLLSAPTASAQKTEGRTAPAVASAAATPAKPGLPTWAFAALGVAVLALVAYIALRPGAKEAPAVVASAKNISETRTAAPTPAPAAAKVADKSIAVLPFTNMSEEKDSAFFADGVHEDILTNLALIPELKVVSRTTVTQYRDTKKTLRQIGAELGVAYILEGSVRRAGSKVRVTGQLINARTDEHVWAKKYDRDLSDIFAIQASLADEIATALQAAITPEAKKQIERRPTENPVAYDAFLKARDTRNKARSGAPAPLKLAENYFQSAVDQDPKFAAAWGELAVAHALHVFWEIDHSPARLASAEAAIQRAISLAPDAPDVINLTGTYAYYAHRDYAKANEQFEKLARLKPNDPTVFASLGLVQRRQGRWADSLANLRRAVELDPGNPGYLRNLIQSLQNGRRWPELLVEQRRFITLVDDKLSAEAELSRFYSMATGSTKEGDAWLAGPSPEQFNSPKAISLRQSRARGIGDFAEFIRLDRLQPYYDGDGTEHHVQALSAAVAYAAVGDTAGAVQRLGDFPAQLRARVLREPTNPRIRGELALMEALLGNKTEALGLAREGYEMLPESRDALDGVNFSLWALVRVQAWVGEKDAAFAGLTHALRVPSSVGGANGIRHNPWLVPLRGDPRFEALLNDPANNQPLF
jgi:TolB-like protein